MQELKADCSASEDAEVLRKSPPMLKMMISTE